jgi:hypothetical protein
MNIDELLELSISDAVSFHNQLNPALWHNQELKPIVRYKLLQIAKDFAEFIGIDDLNLVDIIITGSNTSFNYTKHSDIDLHLVVKVDSNIKKELFDAKKGLWNEQHNVKVKGFNVEVYVQDANEPHVSSGIYSVLNGKWLKTPKPTRPTLNDVSIIEKYQTYSQKIKDVIASENKEKLEELKDNIKRMRQNGLEKEGEFSVENITFKLLRNQGDIEDLMNEIAKLRDQELSLEQSQRE